MKKMLREIIVANQTIKNKACLVADRCVDVLFELRPGADEKILHNVRNYHQQISELCRSHEVDMNEIIGMYVDLGGD